MVLGGNSDEKGAMDNDVLSMVSEEVLVGPVSFRPLCFLDPHIFSFWTVHVPLLANVSMSPVLKNP